MENFYVTEDLYATQGQRLANLFIDRIFTYALLFALGFFLTLLGELTGLYSLVEWMNDISSLEDILITTLSILIYYCLTEVFLSRTFAKYITKTIVVMEDGSRPDSQTMIKRALCRFIPFDPLTFIGSPCRGWHDTISDTYVVKKNAFEKKENYLTILKKLEI